MKTETKTLIKKAIVVTIFLVIGLILLNYGQTN